MVARFIRLPFAVSSALVVAGRLVPMSPPLLEIIGGTFDLVILIYVSSGVSSVMLRTDVSSAICPNVTTIVNDTYMVSFTPWKVAESNVVSFRNLKRTPVSVESSPISRSSSHDVAEKSTIVYTEMTDVSAFIASGMKTHMRYTEHACRHQASCDQSSSMSGSSLLFPSHSYAHRLGILTSLVLNLFDIRFRGRPFRGGLPRGWVAVHPHYFIGLGYF